jgi:DNA-binding CsgD family transcriptional regulator
MSLSTLAAPAALPASLRAQILPNVDAGWHCPPVAPAAPAARGPGAAPGHGAPPAWLVATLEHIGRGIVVVAALGRVVYANRLARQALEAEGHPLRIAEGALLARPGADAGALADALEAAQRRGLRRLLELGRGRPDAMAVAVLPLPADALGPGTGGTALVSLPLARRTQDLALAAYARVCELTAAETAVLEALAAGASPAEIAREKGVAMSTVRTQICQLRLKTGCRSIRQLVQRVLGLPPMVGVVQ